MSPVADSLMEFFSHPESGPINAPHRADERTARKSERTESSFLDTVVGRRGSLRSILSQVQAVAGTNTTVLIAGETGTGKEVIARAIHELSPRRNRNLVKVTARLCLPASSKANSSGTNAEPSRALSILMSAGSRWRIAALCSSMKLETCHWSFNRAGPCASGA